MKLHVTIYDDDEEYIDDTWYEGDWEALMIAASSQITTYLADWQEITSRPPRKGVLYAEN